MPQYRHIFGYPVAKEMRMAGSFGPTREMLDNQLRDSKAVEAVEKVRKDEEEKKAREDIVKLPEEVISDIFGKLTYAEFKDRYKSVWEQVTDKDHLITGRIQYTTKILKTELVVQSMSRREQTAIALFDPLFGISNTQTSEVKRDLGAYRVIIQTVRLGDTIFPKVTLTSENRTTWAADPAIKQQYDYILDIDPIFFNYILSVLNDVDQAKQLALLENLRNP
jgi:hypothetical protein